MCNILQHANSEDALPDDRLSLEGGISSSDLGELDCGSLLQEEGFPSMGSSAERLGCSKEEVEEETRQLDEFLLEDKQVEDFASSVLDAISCWHYTVQAFLSSAGTVRLSLTACPHCPQLRIPCSIVL